MKLQEPVQQQAPEQAPERVKLKTAFSNGQIPDETQFAELIDAFALRSELPRPQPAPDESQARLRAGWRIGRFDRDAAHAFDPLPSPAPKPCRHVPADGHWYPIVENLHASYAFEIVACASGLVQGGMHAVTHAMALSTLAGGNVRQTFSAPHRRRHRWLPCWLLPPRERVEFRWLRVEGGQPPGSLTLQVRTSRNFNQNHEGRQVMIDYHITRLW